MTAIRRFFAGLFERSVKAKEETVKDAHSNGNGKVHDTTAKDRPGPRKEEVREVAKEMSRVHKRALEWLADR